MALLTDEQRADYESNGFSDVSMTQERKTIFDYTRLTKAIREEFIEILDFANSPTGKKQGWSESKVSSNQHFEFTDNRVRVVNKFNGHRFMGYGRRSESIFRITGSSYSILPQDAPEHHIVYKKLQAIANDYCVDVLGFQERAFTDFEFNIHYYKARAIEKALESRIEKSFNVTINQYVSPGKPYGLNLSDTEGFVEYKNRGRVVVMKTGKGIKKFFKLHGQLLSEEDVKNASNRLNASTNDFKLKVVSGSDIDKYYYQDSYDENFETNSLQNSCMRGDDAQDGNFFAVYKEHAKMLILHNPTTDLIIARAIIWNDVKYIEEDNEAEGLKHGDSVKVMDRIYGAESSYSVFKDWALENGYYRKRYQSYNNEQLWRSPVTKDEIELRFSISINLNDYDFVPYMDTFAWGTSEEVNNVEGFGFYTARDTEGKLEGGDNEYDDDDYYEDDEDDDCEW